MQQHLSKIKKTEIDEIPKEWEVNRLINLCKGKPQYGAAVSAIPKHDGIPRYVRITDIDNNGKLKNNSIVGIEEKEAKPFYLSEGDILFARTGSIGRTYIYSKGDGKCAFAGYLIRFIPEQDKLNLNFLFHFTHSDSYWKWIDSIHTIGVLQNINAEQYSQMPIPLPPLKEQQKIASILSKVDELIQKTEQINAQTQRLKKGLMQRLLIKGIGHTKFKKTELGEIPEKWELYNISKIAELIMGQSPAGDSYNVNGEGIPLLNGPTEFGLEHPTPIQFTTKPTKLCRPEDILLCVRGSTTGRLNISNRIYCIGRGLAAIRGLKNKTNTKWLYYNFLRLQDYIFNIASGGGSTFPNVNRDVLEKISLPYPQFSEQQKIADIINSVDQSIQRNYAIKNNTELLKKGLMQQLLTGKIRVKV